MTKEFPQLEQDLVFPPGETLLETLEHLGMSQLDLAKRTDKSPKHINEIIKGKAPISPEMAILLENATGISATMWMNLERNYQEHLARVGERESLLSQVDQLKSFNVKDVIKFGWIKDSPDKATLAKHLVMFLGISRLDQWDILYDSVPVAYRQSSAFACSGKALTLWLRQGEIQAIDLPCAPYDAGKFRAALQSVRAMTQSLPENFVEEIQTLCSKVGVAVVFVPELKGCRASGATRWLSPSKALIQLSLRYKTDDHLWFTFFHEAGHILLHGKRNSFVELDDRGQSSDEEEANVFSREFLIPSKDYADFVTTHKPHFSVEAVRTFAAQIGISAGIVVGRLQRDGHVPYKNLNGLKRKFKWD